MADDAADLVFVFLKEFPGRRKGNLVDVFVHFLFRHTDTAVDDPEDLLLLVEFEIDLELAELLLIVAGEGQGLHFLGGIHRVCDKLAEEDFVIAVEELLDDREDVFGRYADLSLR